MSQAGRLSGTCLPRDGAGSWLRLGGNVHIGQEDEHGVGKDLVQGRAAPLRLALQRPLDLGAERDLDAAGRTGVR